MAQANAFTDPEKLHKQIDEFIALCEGSRKEFQTKNLDIKVRYEKPASWVGLADYLGVSKETMNSYMNHDTRSHSSKANLSKDILQAISAELARARTAIERITLEHSAAGDYDPRIASMILGGMGYTSKTEETPTVLVKIEGASSEKVSAWSR